MKKGDSAVMGALLSLDFDMFSWVILPLIIFTARIFDVTIGTIRIIFVSRGKRYLAPLMGFFEVLIWIIVISQIMKNLNNFACFIAYAAGFATGNFVGILIEEKLALGMLVVRIILVKDECKMKERLSAAGFGVTSVDAYGVNGRVTIIYTVIKRKDLNDVTKIITRCNSRAFYSVEDARMVRQGVFPHDKEHKVGNLGIMKINRLFGHKPHK